MHVFNHLRLVFPAAILLLMFSPMGVYAQGFTLSGRVVDETTQTPLVGATVKANGAFNGAVTDGEGFFTLKLTINRAVVEVTYLGYEKRVVSVSPDAPFVKIAMAEQDVNIGEVTIVADRIERVFKDNTLHLFDYGFSGDNLIVIQYNRELKRAVLALVDGRDSIIDTDLGPEAPGQLVQDCLGNLHALGKDYACQLWVDKGEIQMYIDPRADFEKLVAPCVGNIGEHYYFDQYRYNSQILTHYAYNGQSEEWFTVDEVSDKKKMHAMLDPLGIYAGIASSREQFMSISNEQWKEIGTISPEFQFQQMAFFYPVHAPLKVIKEEVYIFDHLNREIRRMSKSGDVKEKMAIDYPNQSKWKREIYIDEIRGEAYTLFIRNGIKTLAEIDLKSGQLLGEYKITFPFATHPMVRDGVLYFLYKDSIYDDTNRLYRWRIK